jgi:hypothetical protein
LGKVLNRKLIVCFLFAPLLGLSQGSADRSSSLIKTTYYLNLFMKADPSSNQESADEIVSLINKLEKRKSSFNSDKDFLSYLFTKTHQKLLTSYTEQCTFSALVKDGTYNCLTGTSLYALLLDHFAIDYRVIETNYHIFLIAKTNEGNVLFEATDPGKGFVDSYQEVEKRIARYKQQELQQGNTNKMLYRYQFNLYNTVGLDELLGLMYYNLSIEAYNNDALSASINYLDDAIKLYQSPRVEEFSKIILLTLNAKQLNKSEKEICLKKIQSLRKKMPGLASSVGN